MAKMAGAARRRGWGGGGGWAAKVGDGRVQTGGEGTGRWRRIWIGEQRWIWIGEQRWEAAASARVERGLLQKRARERERGALGWTGGRMYGWIDVCHVIDPGNN